MEQGRLQAAATDYRYAEDEVGVFATELQGAKNQLSAYIHDISRILSATGEGEINAAAAEWHPAAP